MILTMLFVQFLRATACTTFSSICPKKQKARLLLFGVCKLVRRIHRKNFSMNSPKKYYHAIRNVYITKILPHLIAIPQYLFYRRGAYRRFYYVFLAKRWISFAVISNNGNISANESLPNFSPYFCRWPARKP